MIFQKPATKMAVEDLPPSAAPARPAEDTVETVVGPSVNVEGDFASEGNIVVKGSVAGSVHTSRHLSVEAGARVMANVRAQSAQIAGEVKGNMKVKDRLEVLSTAKILGDIDAKVLSVEPGALMYGKITMPGVEEAKARANRAPVGKKIESAPMI